MPHHGRDDLSEVIPGLWQGGYPRYGSWRSLGIKAVVSLAASVVPTATDAAPVLLFPIYDALVDAQGVSREEWEIKVRAAALYVAHLVGERIPVLVHCQAGLNRSGVVVARALMYLGYSPFDAIKFVREARPNALFNPDFVEWLMGEDW